MSADIKQEIQELKENQKEIQKAVFNHLPTQIEELRKDFVVVKEEIIKIRSLQKSINNKTEKIHKVLYGNSEPKKSLIDRMARLETQNKIILAILLSTLTAIVSILLNLVFQ